MGPPGNTLPRGLPESTAALKAAQSAASLAVLIMVFGFGQLCCFGTPMMAFERGEGSWRSVAMFVAAGLSVLGGLFALPCTGYVNRGVGGIRGGPRFKNFEARIAGGVAAKPNVLSRIFRQGLYASLLVAAGQLTALGAALGTGDELAVLLGITAIMLTVSLGSAVSFAAGHSTHAATLGRLPLPAPAPPGTFPDRGSLEALALWFGGAARSACAAAGVVGAVEFGVILLAGVFGDNHHVLAALPLTGGALLGCYAGYQSINTGLRTRDDQIRKGLLWGLLGGAVGTVPVAVSGVVAVGVRAGAWSEYSAAFPLPIRSALGQPSGFCFTLNVLPLIFCGITLGVFGRELATRRSNEERLVQQQSRGGL